MNNGVKSGQIDFYYISSNFSDILIKLGDKLTSRNKKTLILFKSLEDLNDIDRLLWIKEKCGFIPHKLINQKIYEKDKIVLSQNLEIPNYLEKQRSELQEKLLDYVVGPDNYESGLWSSPKFCYSCKVSQEDRNDFLRDMNQCLKSKSTERPN